MIVTLRPELLVPVWLPLFLTGILLVIIATLYAFVPRSRSSMVRMLMLAAGLAGMLICQVLYHRYGSDSWWWLSVWAAYVIVLFLTHGNLVSLPHGNNHLPTILVVLGALGIAALIGSGPADMGVRSLIIQLGLAFLLLQGAIRVVLQPVRARLDYYLAGGFALLACLLLMRGWSLAVDLNQADSLMWLGLHIGLIVVVFTITLILLVESMRDMMENLRQEGNIDVLTGIYNRRGFEERANMLLARRSAWPIALVMTDLDWFKVVNDTFGHPAGDRVLRQFALVLNDNVRVGDVVGRYGGEEFILMLAATRMDDAVILAERLRLQIESMAFRTLPEDFRITASFGVAELRRDESLQSLILHADSALYEAKRRGRNRTVVSCPSAEVTAGLTDDGAAVRQKE